MCCSPLVTASTIVTIDVTNSRNLRQAIQETIRQTDENICAIPMNTQSMVVVVGSTGSAKSTLINYLAGRRLQAEKKFDGWDVKVENPLPGFKFSSNFTTSATIIPTGTVKLTDAR